MKTEIQINAMTRTTKENHYRLEGRRGQDDFIDVSSCGASTSHITQPHRVGLFQELSHCCKERLNFEVKPLYLHPLENKGGEWQHSIKSSFCFCYEAPTYNWRRSSAVLYENCPINGNDCSADLKYWHFTTFYHPSRGALGGVFEDLPRNGN